MIGYTYHEMRNIIQFVGDIDKKYSPFDVSFCNEKYPVSDTGLKNLIKDIQNASIMNGYHMVRNGYQIVPSKCYKQIFCFVLKPKYIMLIFKNDVHWCIGI